MQFYRNKRARLVIRDQFYVHPLAWLSHDSHGHNSVYKSRNIWLLAKKCIFKAYQTELTETTNKHYFSLQNLAWAIYLLILGYPWWQLKPFHMYQIQGETYNTYTYKPSTYQFYLNLQCIKIASSILQWIKFMSVSSSWSLKLFPIYRAITTLPATTSTHVFMIHFKNIA